MKGWTVVVVVVCLALLAGIAHDIRTHPDRYRGADPAPTCAHR